MRLLSKIILGGSAATAFTRAQQPLQSASYGGQANYTAELEARQSLNYTAHTIDMPVSTSYLCGLRLGADIGCCRSTTCRMTRAMSLTRTQHSSRDTSSTVLTTSPEVLFSFTSEARQVAKAASRISRQAVSILS